MADTFIADLHIHSRFSRATSARLNPAHLAAWAGIKGVKVLGTGDFTHPGWRAELAAQLERDEASGLYRLKKAPDPAAELPEPLAAARGGENGPLFLLQAEISSIYKRHGRVRKVHNLVFMPDLHAAEIFCRKLEAVGNLAADGRPILGLDSALLLEMVLSSHPDAALVPAHIWTPWFSVFGSKSGFDSLEECFGDLAGEIFAMETGLSSDPAMNRLWSHLDGITLISNSDAHSGENLGREGNVFSGPPSYSGIFNALKRRPADCAHIGSLEFFPEEGKYHLDGHRACQVVMDPGQSRAHGNICPVCGKTLTIGVLNRVMELADRPAPPRDGAWPGFFSLMPLPEIMGEILDVGAKSKAVAARYAQTIAKFGPELEILRNVDENELRRHWEALGEAVARMRRGEVQLQGGYDGQYGVARVFSAQERRDLKTAGRAMASLAPASARDGMKAGPARRAAKALLTGATEKAPARQEAARTENAAPAAAIRLTPEQEAALDGDGPALITAGPGSGKTRTLVEGARRLLARGENPDRILALTFTRRAAEEMRARLAKTLGGAESAPHCLTLHALAWRNLREGKNPPLLPAEDSLRAMFAQLAAGQGLDAAEAAQAFEAAVLARETLSPPPAGLEKLCAAYARMKQERNLRDHTDLLEKCLQNGLSRSFDFVFVDEIQDLTPLQLALIRKIVPEGGRGFFGIGDPNQAIYSFRGVRADVGARLKEFWPDLAVKSLPVSHRSAQGVLDAAESLLPGQHLRAAAALPSSLRLFHAPDENMEARWVAANVSLLLGGTSLSRAGEAPAAGPFGIAPDGGHLAPGSCSPGDIAVLVRLKAQIPALAGAMREAGLPFAVPEQEGFWHDERVAEMLRRASAFLAQQAEARPAAPAPLLRAVPAAAPESGEENAWNRLAPEDWLQGPAALARRLAGQAPFSEDFAVSAPLRAVEALWRAMGGWPELLSEISLRGDLDEVKARAERVQIMTLHACKGLEFRAVFICGLENGLLPLDFALLRPDQSHGSGRAGDPAEERRLLNVGLTRATESVYLSRAARRKIWGAAIEPAPSPFLEVLERHCKRSILKTNMKSVGKKLSLL